MCSKLVAKLILIVTNFILFIAGGVLLGFGIASLVKPNDVQKFVSQMPHVDEVSEALDLPSLVTSSAKFMIIVGAIIFVFSFLGCAGAMCEVKWMLFLYWISIVILIILEIALIIFAVVKPGMLKEEMVSVLSKKWDAFTPETLFDNYTLHLPTQLFSLSWVTIQFKFGCCGISNYTDYTNLTGWNRKYKIEDHEIVAVVPPSCCVTKDKDIPKSTLPEDFKQHLKDCLQGINYFNRKGCIDAVEQTIKQSNHIPIIVCSVVIFVELLAIACAVYLWKYTDSGKM